MNILSLSLLISTIIVFALGIIAYRNYKKYRQLDKDYRDACNLINSMSEAYYNQYSKHYEKRAA